MFLSTPSTPLFFTTLILGSLIALFRNDWLTMWGGLELNLLSFLPIIISSHSPQESEAAAKYFLVQALGSTIILAGILSPNYMFFTPLLVYALFLKGGLAPLHTWFPRAISLISWPIALLLSTWQKLVPILFLICVFTFPHPSATSLPVILRPVVGAVMGVNQSHLRPLLAYSSIRHMGWALSAAIYSPSLALFSLFVYIVTSLPLFFLMWILKTNASIRVYSLVSSDKPLALSLVIMLLSLAGIPPFAGFIPKLLTLWLIVPDNPLFGLVLISSSLITTYYYITIVFHLTLNYTSSHHVPPASRPSILAPNLLSLIVNIVPYVIILFCALTLFNQP